MPRPPKHNIKKTSKWSRGVRQASQRMHRKPEKQTVVEPIVICDLEDDAILNM